VTAFLDVLPVAHLGHWWTYVLYAVPVLIVLASVVMTLVKERREERDSDEG
jgi:hypothetical protein